MYVCEYTSNSSSSWNFQKLAAASSPMQSQHAVKAPSSKYKSHRPGHSPLGKLGRTPCWVSSLRPSNSVVATAVRYVRKAGELAKVPHDLRLALSVQVVVGAPGSKQCINYFKLVTF